ncbi:hypothetical protein ACHAWF_008972 [Thalassiosira exigua]
MARSKLLGPLIVCLHQHAVANAQRHRQSLRGGNALSSLQAPSDATKILPPPPHHASSSLITSQSKSANFVDRSVQEMLDLDASETWGLGGSSAKVDCDSGDGQLFELDIETDYSSCETSWGLERVYFNSATDREEAVYVDGYENDYFDTSDAISQSFCLGEGKYRFVIYDAFGDDIEAPGYYLVALDGEVIAGSSNFGYQESTLFIVTSPTKEAATTTTAVDLAETSDFLMKDEITTVALSWDDASNPEIDDAPTVPDRISGLVDEDEVWQNDTLSPTAPPTASPIAPPTASSQFTSTQATNPVMVDMSHVDGHASTSVQTWIEIANDDFVHDIGLFQSSIDNDEHVTFYPYVKGRRGVMRLQSEDQNLIVAHASASSGSVKLDESTKQVKVIFSYFANSMEANDGFCLDYSIDDGASWHSQKCWHAIEDFNNGEWYDDVTVILNLKNVHGDIQEADDLRIRFRSKANSLHDDILFDKVKLLRLVETEMKDSML